MAGTPRKAAMAGVDRNGALKGMPGQNANPPRKTAGDTSKSAYVRKDAGVDPTNLPLKRSSNGSDSGTTPTTNDHDGDE